MPTNDNDDNAIPPERQKELRLLVIQIANLMPADPAEARFVLKELQRFLPAQEAFEAEAGQRRASEHGPKDEDGPPD